MAERVQQSRDADGAGVVSVSLGQDAALRLEAYAAAGGHTRSSALRELVTRGTAVMLELRAHGADARAGSVAMPDGSVRRLTASLVRDAVLPLVAGETCDDAAWLDACPASVRDDMAADVAAAASSLAPEVRWETLAAVARVMALRGEAPWLAGGELRAAALAEADARIAELLPGALDGSAEQDTWLELAWRSAERLVYSVADVAGVPPDGPLATLAWLLLGRASAAAELRAGARATLAEGLGADDAALLALADAARTALDPDSPADAARDAALALAYQASRLAAPADAPTVPDADDARRSLALSRKGARAVTDYAAAHPRAKLRDLQQAAGMSYSTVQRRVAELEEAGVMRNVGTRVTPLWQVSGVDHAAEDLLTERQAQVLECLRREQPLGTAATAEELGISTSLLNNVYRELGKLGLAAQGSNGRWYAVDAGAAGRFSDL